MPRSTISGQVWTSKKNFSAQFSLLKHAQADISTNPNDNVPPKINKLHRHTYKTFLENKYSQNFIFQNH